jgi:hypothetical protein
MLERWAVGALVVLGLGVWELEIMLTVGRNR